MLKAFIIISALLGVVLSPCIAQDAKELEADAPPVITKFDKMDKENLQDALKALQKEVLVAERTAKLARRDAAEAAAAYKSADDAGKPDALLRMIETDAESREPVARYKQVHADFEAAKRAYLNCLLLE